MTRILTPLATGTLVFMMVALALGFSLRGGDIRDPADTTAQHWATVHRLWGVGTGLVVVLVQSIVVTYFIGTSRWCREVVETYQLDVNLVAGANRLKRRTFPLAAMGMLAAVGLVASGAAADTLRGGLLGDTFSWTGVHFLTAVVVIGFTAASFLLEWQNIAAQQTLIARILAEVKRIRDERGLDT